MNGAMTWYSYTRRIKSGKSEWSAKWHLLQRGLFLVLVQVTWVNSSWGGFADWKPGHIGIIACIGLAMCFLTFIVHLRWQVRLGAALALFAVHPFLLRIPYDLDNTWAVVLMQTFVDAGEFNKYPVIPWLGLAIMGSVMASGWADAWRTTRKRALMSLGIAALAFALAIGVRMGRGFGNISPFSDFGHWSFFLDQKYPPSLYHNLWFFGAVVTGVVLIDLLSHIAAPDRTLGIGAAVFYCVHIGISRHLLQADRDLPGRRRGGSLPASRSRSSMPLARWFAVPGSEANHIIKMI
jgi:hypothetical protein